MGTAAGPAASAAPTVELSVVPADSSTFKVYEASDLSGTPGVVTHYDLCYLDKDDPVGLPVRQTSGTDGVQLIAIAASSATKILKFDLDGSTDLKTMRVEEDSNHDAHTIVIEAGYLSGDVVADTAFDDFTVGDQIAWSTDCATATNFKTIPAATDATFTVAGADATKSFTFTHVFP